MYLSVVYLLDILQDLLVIEQEIPLAVQHVVDGGGEDLVIVAVEPEVGVLPDVGGVVARVQRPDVVDHGEEDVLVVGLGQVLAVALPRVAAAGDEGAHVDDLGEVDPGGDLLVQPARVLEPLEVEGGDHGQLLQGQLLGALLVTVAVGTPGDTILRDYQSLICQLYQGFIFTEDKQLLLAHF